MDLPVQDEVVEKRREDRLQLLGGDISLLPEQGGTAVIRGITADISRSGIAVVTDREIYVGSSFMIRGDGDGMGHCDRRAIARWCRKIDEGIFKVGLNFF